MLRETRSSGPSRSRSAHVSSASAVQKGIRFSLPQTLRCQNSSSPLSSRNARRFLPASAGNDSLNILDIDGNVTRRALASLAAPSYRMLSLSLYSRASPVPRSELLTQELCLRTRRSGPLWWCSGRQMFWCPFPLSRFGTALCRARSWKRRAAAGGWRAVCRVSSFSEACGLSRSPAPAARRSRAERQVARHLRTCTCHGLRPSCAGGPAGVCFKLPATRSACGAGSLQRGK